MVSEGHLDTHPSNTAAATSSFRDVYKAFFQGPSAVFASCVAADGRLLFPLCSRTGQDITVAIETDHHSSCPSLDHESLTSGMTPSAPTEDDI